MEIMKWHCCSGHTHCGTRPSPARVSRPTWPFSPWPQNRGVDPIFPVGASPVDFGRPTATDRARWCRGGSPCGEGPDLGLGWKRGSPGQASGGEEVSGGEVVDGGEGVAEEG
jgi:hypothetical protein